MSYRNHLILKHTEGEKPLFAIGLAVVFRSEGKAPEYELGVSKVDAVLSQISKTLGWVPREHATL